MNMKQVFIFIAGAAVGSLVTWKIVEEKYKKLADEEIESVVERFKDRENEQEIVAKSNNYPWGSEDKKEENNVSLYPEELEAINRKTEMGFNQYPEDKEGYIDSLIEEGYINDEEVNPVKEYIKPYVIAPEEFGEFGNETKSLIYYSDFTLADDEDEIICDPESLIGDGLEHFGEFEDDAVHIRNENIECDFEILKSEKTFTEVYKEGR